MDDPQYQLIAEQLGRLKDNIESRFQKIEASACHEKQLTAVKLEALTKAGETNAAAITDHEARLRKTNDAVTALVTSHTIGQAVQAGISLILAAVAAYIGSRW
ncbi:MAG: hypothetical protein P4L50_15940 [Anaerolineaceae bacterium]|nr:hypothetical protein [Anaerolineaceae bacterium]